jgi:hypothetical protein
MKLIFNFLAVICFSFSFLSQTLEKAPLSENPYLPKQDEFTLKSGSNSFDSTIIFIPDTIGLPFIDDFSSSKFQTYEKNFSLPGIYSTIHYKLLDPTTSQPLDDYNKFTNVPTFKRTFDLSTGTFSDVNFSQVAVKVGDLRSYPVVYQTEQLYPAYYVYDTIGAPDVSDTVFILNPSFVQDSARQFFAPINDPSKIWIDNFVFHNFRYALNPRTLGVATFDGLNQRGFPYQINTTSSNVADRLTSKPINLGVNSIADSLYLSFLYQPEGLGDVPESTDSLVLEFYAPEMNQWFHQWSVAGSPVHDFRAVHIPITDNKFLKKGFQFRFKNYGALSGALDHFHLDYVMLRSQSFFDDTLFRDFAFVYPLNSLLKTYTFVPWDHYVNSTDNNMTDELKVMVHNGSGTPENYQNGIVNVLQNGTQIGSYTLPGFTLAEQQINYAPQTTHSSFHNLTSGFQYPKNLGGTQRAFEVKASANAQFPNLPQNDSTTFFQEFYNFYAYDDGTAEAAFGPTGTQSRLAIEFNAYEADSLIGVSLHFVPTVNDVTQKLFLITVWDDNNGKPGEILYEDDAFNARTPIYSTYYNQYLHYYFTDLQKVAVGNKFHIGWRQLDPQRLNLGLDRNIDNSSKIRYSVDGGATWLSSPFDGSPMLRPIFSTGLDQTLGLNFKNPETVVWNIYPNPVNETLNISWSSDKERGEAKIVDAYGRIQLSGEENTFDVSNLPAGIYFIKLSNHPTATKKFIKL